MSQPTKPCKCSPVEVGEPDIRGEIGQGEGRQQPAVFLAGLLAHRVGPLPAWRATHLSAVVQGRPAPLLNGFGVARELDRLRLDERGGGLLALAPAATVHRDILRATAIDPGVGGALEQHPMCCLVEPMAGADRALGPRLLGPDGVSVSVALEQAHESERYEGVARGEARASASPGASGRVPALGWRACSRLT